MLDSVKSHWHIKYYSLSSIRDFEHSSDSISNNRQKIGRRTRSEAKKSENIVTKSILNEFSNVTYGLNTLLTTKQSKKWFLKEKIIWNTQHYVFFVSFIVFLSSV